MIKNLLHQFIFECCISIFDVRNIALLTNLYRGCSAEDVLEKIYFEAMDKRTIVELGLGGAYTTSAAFLACKDSAGHLWTVDWCKDKHRCKRAVERIKRLGLERYWSLWKGNFFDFPRKWNFANKIDFLLIDEDGLVNMDKLLALYEPLMASHGVIYVHNVGIREKTRKEVLSFCTKHLWTYKFENTRYGLAIMKRELEDLSEGGLVD